MLISDLRLEMTCPCAPEQYDVFDANDIKVGYLRLRHGYFRAEAYNEVVYDADTQGDGCFESDERDFHLNKALTAIAEYFS